MNVNDCNNVEHDERIKFVSPRFSIEKKGENCRDPFYGNVTYNMQRFDSRKKQWVH